MDQVMPVVFRLLSQTQALAAATAYCRLLQSGEEGDPAQRAQMERVVAVLGMRDAIARLDPAERSVVIAFVRSYLKQALLLVEEPSAMGAWSHSDPAILQSQGAASGMVATLLKEAGIGRDGMRVLDVGTGVAGLALAFCRVFPGATVVGVDPWEPALELARENVAAAGLGDMVHLVRGRIENFSDPVGFDLIWLPSFFIPPAALRTALAVAYNVARPGGTVVLGVSYSADDDPLAQAVDDLVTVRSGGSAIDTERGMRELALVGFTDLRTVAPDAPLRLAVGVRK